MYGNGDVYEFHIMVSLFLYVVEIVFHFSFQLSVWLQEQELVTITLQHYRELMYIDRNKYRSTIHR